MPPAEISIVYLSRGMQGDLTSMMSFESQCCHLCNIFHQPESNWLLTWMKWSLITEIDHESLVELSHIVIVSPHTSYFVNILY